MKPGKDLNDDKAIKKKGLPKVFARVCFDLPNSVYNTSSENSF
jgi:hypothetical protein